MIGYSIYKPDIRYRCIFLRDITEKARLKSIAQAANAMDNIGFIFSGIRHEIGNPLNSLKMALSVLKENFDNFSPEIVNEYIDRGIADIGRMEYLLKSLKTFSLYEHAELIDLPLEEFMNKFLSLIERDFQSQGIHILVESSLNIAKIRVDKRALHQALLNIFNNAAEAFEGQSDPQIKVAAELRGQLVWLTISDNGCGISPSQFKHLFKPFNTSKPAGNGLGLVITRKLLALMGIILLVSLVMVFIVVSRSLKPLSHFTKVASDFADGKVDKKIEVKGQDEIARLADVLERLRVSLKAAMDRLQKR